MRSSEVCDASKARPMSGSATLATERFRLATAATRISAISTSPERSGAVDDLRTGGRGEAVGVVISALPPNGAVAKSPGVRHHGPTSSLRSSMRTVSTIPRTTAGAASSEPVHAHRARCRRYGRDMRFRALIAGCGRRHRGRGTRRLLRRRLRLVVQHASGSGKQAVCDARDKLETSVRDLTDPSLLTSGKSGIQYALDDDASRISTTSATRRTSPTSRRSTR